MQSIKVDDAVYEFLAGHARPFDDTPNTVLRRLLGIDAKIADLTKPAADNSASDRAVVQMRSAVVQMRSEAKAAIRAALEARQLDSGLAQQPRDGRGRGPREQRFVTPRGQTIYIRTRSFDPRKEPFFSMSPESIQDADWYVFWAERRGSVVLPGDELRANEAGIYIDQNGMHKPTFVIDSDICEMYVHGELRSVARWRDAYEAIAEREETLPGR